MKRIKIICTGFILCGSFGARLGTALPGLPLHTYEVSPMQLGLALGGILGMLIGCLIVLANIESEMQIKEQGKVQTNSRGNSFRIKNLQRPSLDPSLGSRKIHKWVLN